MHIYNACLFSDVADASDCKADKSCMIQEHYMLENLPTTFLLPIPAPIDPSLLCNFGIVGLSSLLVLVETTTSRSL